MGLKCDPEVVIPIHIKIANVNPFIKDNPKRFIFSELKAANDILVIVTNKNVPKNSII